MKVKIRDTIYDTTVEPVMLILSDEDKSNISQMHPDHYIYCSFPEGTNEEEIKEWMSNR